jgi:hypothetical protein
MSPAGNESRSVDSVSSGRHSVSVGSRRRRAAEIDFRVPTLSQARRVIAHSHDIRYAARSGRCTSDNEEREGGTRRGKCRSADFHASRDVPLAQAAAHRHAVPSSYSAVAFCRGRSTMSAATPEVQKRRSGHIDRVPSNSRWEHRRSRDNSRRAAASVFPRTRIGDRPRKKRLRCISAVLFQPLPFILHLRQRRVLQRTAARGERLLERVETSRELLVGPAECGLRLDAELA